MLALDIQDNLHVVEDIESGNHCIHSLDERRSGTLNCYGSGLRWQGPNYIVEVP